ncbi:hypothetical protein QJQ45_009240 [Haematococcus lacustris]|nr:hypothetical protein QJQ45_009240 [Haematococcus lacustris]
MYCKNDAAQGLKSCGPCFFKRRASKARTQAKQTAAQIAWESHKAKALLRFGPDTWLLIEEFALLMYRAGPNGPRATCVELVPVDEDDPDGPLRLCGGFGTVNRIMSDIKSYRDKDQRCNVLCHHHNARHESRRNAEMATASLAAAAAAPKPGSSKDCPIELD